MGDTHPLDPGRHEAWSLDVDAGPVLLVGTRKGAFALSANGERTDWTSSGPAFLGHIIHHLVLDPRDRRTLLCAARAGHLGPTVFRSVDLGKSWQEATRPPAFEKAAQGEQGRVVDQVFWLTPGHGDERDTWYAGSSPEGLFRSEDAGSTWTPVSGWNDHPRLLEFTGGSDNQGTPDGSPLHSIRVDPRDRNHLYIVSSSGGVFESTDCGGDWRPLNQNVEANFLPEPYPEVGQDTHCLQIHPLFPDILYQQNHCGIYRLERPGERWERIGDNMPKDVGDIGFPMVVHPRDPSRAWVFPMDGSDVWPRTSPGGRPAVFGTRDSGKTWERLDSGMPTRNAWMTVKRQAMVCDQQDPVGLYFGTTTGEVWGSIDEGASWSCIARHLPHVYSVEVAAF